MSGNLVRKRNQLLINSLASGDVAVSDGVISIKQYGNQINVSNITKFVKVENSAGAAKVSRILVKPVFPALSDYGYEGGVGILRNYQFTGDPQKFYGHSKPYTYKIENLKAVASGYLNVEDRAELAGYIMEMINDDPTAVVTATVRYYLAFTASGTVAVTDLRGNVVLAETTYANAAAAQVGLDALTGISAVVDSTDGVWVTASEGLVFTLQSTKWALGDTWINLTQKDIEYPFTYTSINGFGQETVLTPYSREVLPLADIQRLFPILPISHVGSVPVLPLASTAYTKFTFHIEHDDAAGMVGSNRIEKFEEIVEIFMPTSVAEGAYWATVLYPTLEEAGLISVTLGATTLTLTGASGAGAGTMAVVAVPGFTVSSVKYYADASNTGTINVSTGVVANGTDADVFYAEIQYAHLDYLVVSQITCTLVATGSFTGAALTSTTILAYENLGRWDLVTGATGLGTPVLRDFGVAVENQYWFFDASATGVCDSVTGTITTAPDDADVLEGDVKYAGKTTVTKFDHTFTTGNINNQTIVSIPV